MRSGLSPEWDRRFDEAFTDLVTHDDDFIRTEFTCLTRASWPNQPPANPLIPEARPEDPGRAR